MHHDSKSVPSRVSCVIPKYMSPEKSVFESLGFTFEEIEDKHRYKATLPVGWRIRSVVGCYMIKAFLDENGKVRGNFSNIYDFSHLYTD